MMKVAKENTTEAERGSTSPSDWVDIYGDYLFNYAIGQVRNHSVAEDLVQETFLAGLKAREHYSGASSERTWLTGILRHKIFDYLRKNCRERTWSFEPEDATSVEDNLEESTFWLHETAAECAGPNRRMELEEFRDALETALGQLPPRIAQVFRMYQVEELPTREVCEELHISENNLWVMLHRARKQLRQLLGGWWEEKDTQNDATSPRA